MHVHWVFVTKYRRGVFTAQILHDLRSIFTGVCSDFESQRVEFDGEDDQVQGVSRLDLDPARAADR